MKELNKYDYLGSDTKKQPYAGMNYAPETFSIGIFKWVQKASGKGLKKTAVTYRVKGFMSNPKPVFDRADEVCMLMDKGDWNFNGKVSETVKS